MDSLLKTIKHLISLLEEGGAQLTAPDCDQLESIIQQQRQLLKTQREILEPLLNPTEREKKKR